jgi:hypothetical protein
MSGSPFGIGEFLTGQKQSQAQEDAANIQAGAQMSAAQLQAQTAAQQLAFQQQQAALQQPWVQAGTNALAGQQAMLGKYPDLSTGAYQQSDYDKWVMQQGVNSLAASGAASGMYGSGNMGAALSDYGQNQAGSQYQQWRSNALGDYLNQYNQLAGLSQTGQVSAQNIGQQGLQTGSQQLSSAYQQGQSMIGGANALAAGRIGQANIFGNTMGQMSSGLGQGFNQGMNYYNQQNALYNNNLNTGYGTYGDTWSSPTGDMSEFGTFM